MPNSNVHITNSKECRSLIYFVYETDGLIHEVLRLHRLPDLKAEFLENIVALPTIVINLERNERKKERSYFLNSTQRHTILFVNNTKLYNIHMTKSWLVRGKY